MLTASVVIITATTVILSMLLWRYRQLVKQADMSSRLAKDVWDSVASRFSVVDARIIDLMAKTEVLYSRLELPHMTSQHRPLSVASSTDVGASMVKVRESVRKMSSPAVTLGEGTDTEVKVLRLLAKGPKTSAQIKEEVGRSREHTARLMKTLFDRGLVMRNDSNKPYVYEITESGKNYVVS